LRSVRTLSAGPRQIPCPAEERRIFGMTSGFFGALLAHKEKPRERRSNRPRGQSETYDPEPVLQLLVELTRRARDKDPASDASFTVFNPLRDARRFAALGTIRALGGVHFLLAIGCFCDLGHFSLLRPPSGSILPLGRGPRSDKNLGVISGAGATAAGSSCRVSNPYSPELILHEGQRGCLVLLVRYRQNRKSDEPPRTLVLPLPIRQRRNFTVSPSKNLPRRTIGHRVRPPRFLWNPYRDQADWPDEPAI
jgi:hypothetical protein